jgi:hydrogenase maturation protein HypF
MERRAIAVQGAVQGVGFRPFVHGLASRLQLGGFVRNQTGGVQIEVEGEAGPLDQFLSCLVTGAPPLAHIDELSWHRQTPCGDRRFRVEQSDKSTSGPVVVVPDVATCDECLAELLNPHDRRFRYPFLNCTNCGPRLTVVTGAPYDRERTTMAGFKMCPACRSEYEDPADRRFQAQPTACPDCGPRLQLLNERGRPIDCDHPIAFFVIAMGEGKIGAVKGLGGYHLVCDARNQAAIVALRQRKRREEKPFAVMVRDVAAAEELCSMGELERELLTSSRRPIVLMRKRSAAGFGKRGLGAPGIAEGIAPNNPFLGVMLPYTPLHHLLVNDMRGVPLVMTSGNRSDEPIAIDEADATERLSGIADLFLVHNRPIRVRCDDAVTRVIAGAVSPVRRSRGYAPEPIPTPWSCAVPMLAVGGQLKATFALGRDRRAILSHHLGDLDHLDGYRAFERDIALYEQLFSLRPECIACDMHPDYASTRYAKSRAAEGGMSCVAVQHHHAHMASCMAEHGLPGPVIGVTFDGTGFGTDGAIWGGEFLVGNYGGFERAARLHYVAMPGGDLAAREPWRMAAAHLMDAQASCDKYERRLPAASLRTIRRMVERKINSPMTSSVGRLFDAVASLAGVRDSVSHEGQAAMQLEWLASSVAPEAAYPFELDGTGASIVVDTRPLVRAVSRDVDRDVEVARIARRFHSTLVEMIRGVCIMLRKTHKVDKTVLSGGVFMNALLTIEVTARLEQEGFAVYRHVKVPPNDGGLSLGQLAVAASQQRRH